ncbi:MAG: MmcQ/YjbR family DNA-binding protein [Lachnospiraceae bacterium]|nr:MmcQ/YjbR family DNA-binding protein [Lachnospiraceae bacterium]
MDRQQVFDHVKEKYGADPEYLWRRFPDYAVFRHKDNGKWFGLIMKVPRERLGLSGEGWADILNVKMDDPVYADVLTRQEGIFRGYHISRGNWISLLLDGAAAEDQIRDLIALSFSATASRETRQKTRPPKEWIVPANPAYYDVVGAFRQADLIDWKQGKGIRTGDTVYLYVGAPVSAILFRCLVTETDIPCSIRSEKVRIDSLMKISLEKRYGEEEFPFRVLKDEYGIRAVRGPRGIPDALSRALKE